VENQSIDIAPMAASETTPLPIGAISVLFWWLGDRRPEQMISRDLFQAMISYPRFKVTLIIPDLPFVWHWPLRSFTHWKFLFKHILFVQVQVRIRGQDRLTRCVARSLCGSWAYCFSAEIHLPVPPRCRATMCGRPSTLWSGIVRLIALTVCSVYRCGRL